MVLALERPARRLLARRSAWTATVLVNGMIMTLYLWHMTAMLLALGVALALGGVGLGLAIVKHVLSRHDGDLTVTSDLGKGSEFRCLFPARRLAVNPPVTLAGGKKANA